MLRVPESPPAVRVDGVWKTFRIPKEQVHTLKERVLHPFRRTQYNELSAVHDMSFDVRRGEFFGIVGRNGSGKSTLLKCMAGIYATDRGRIYADGQISSFIELGVGFNMDLPARDNVMLNATMLGLSPREALRRFDTVIDFAELHDFVDLKLKNYSSGMLVRLAFSTMIQVDADILLIDEVLAVGDAAFQQKCFDEFGRMRREHKTVVFVTHDMSLVQRFCDRAMLVDKGRIIETGETQHISNRYLEINFGRRDDEGQVAEADAERFGDGRARILDAWFEDEHGERTDVVHTGRPFTHAMQVRFAEDVDHPVFSVTVENQDAIPMITADEGTRRPLGLHRAGEELVVRFRFQNALAPERYLVTPGVADGGGWRWLDRPMRLQRLTVTGDRLGAGVIEQPYDVEVERSGAPADEVIRP
jgi:ABC-type polysaccharide/polyol phosphate transport system ATPase subunit